LSSPNVPVGLGDKVEEHAGCDAPDGEDPSKLYRAYDKEEDAHA